MSSDNWVFKEAVNDLKRRFPSPQMFDLKKIKAAYHFNDREAQHVLDHGVELGLFGQMDHLYCVKRQTAPAQDKGENENSGN